MPTATESVLPLNEFQRLILGWDEAQPFVGIDVIEARQPVDADLLRHAVEEELAVLGVCFPIAEGDTVRYRARSPEVPIESIDPGPDVPPLTALADQCSRELNSHFQPGVDPLVRVWVLRSAPTQYVGMTWQHWPIDGVSAAQLFRRMLARYVGSPINHPDLATTLVAPEPGAIAPPWSRWQQFVVTLSESIRESFAFTRIFPVPRPKLAGLRVHLIEVPHPARPPGTTLNEVVTAALLGALADVLPERYRNSWRRRISVVNFVDLRAYAGGRLDRIWGLFLAFAILHLPEPRPTHWHKLVDAVRRQALRIKDGQLFFAGLHTFRVLRLAWTWLPKRWRWTLPYQLTPFTAALTNTRFRAEWNGPLFVQQFGRSWRVAPLGCLVPLAVDVCSKGEQVSIALTCEANGRISAAIEEIKLKLTETLARRDG